MGMLVEQNRNTTMRGRSNFDQRRPKQKPERYNFNKYGDKPYETELDRRQNSFYEKEEAKNIRYRKPVNETFAKALIDDIIRLHKPVSGYVIKLLFDEYQRSKFESDQYTMFYSSYVMKSKDSSSNGNKPHCSISNNNLYLLFINNWGDIVPRKVCKEFDMVNPVMNALNKDATNTEPDEEEFIKSIAIRLHDKAPDDWDNEFDSEGNPDWTGPVHSKYMNAVKSILAYVRSTGNNMEE